MKDTIIVKPRVINEAISYWAMFYCAVLKTIYNQKNLKFNFDNGSLESYRGKLKHPSNFFNQMKSAVSNHGFEYLMIDYLRSIDGIDITKKLLDRLLNKRGITNFEYLFMNIYKVGSDSKLQDIIEKYDDISVKIFVPHNNYKAFTKKNEAGFTYNIGNIGKTFIHSDLLMLISDGKKHTYGFVGEVEGLHGENLFTPKYWAGTKAKYSSFAIGASERKKKIEDIEVKNNILISEDFEGREILHFSNANQFVKDFKLALSNIELCLNGHFSNISHSDESHAKIFKFISDGWSKPLNETIIKLESFIGYSFSSDVTYNQSSENSIFKPSIIYSLSEFPLYQLDK
ncbi:hypothetical protein E2566_08205 [Pectobacterium punjabense]|uniref:Uncharacterized protein n=1 Tax=Pectobacterium punjabense TaxID=2108399 RepID=A0ABX6L0Q0_9GAMM|nr:hypothetical protein [Pectobacterium punjabense]MBS4430485.1 hypothetical protein [Pectobacterium punjabense]PTA62198.1 hypothetical protein C9I36_21255 [Pectobacterium punjabense]QJA19901.1 hypothetical protein E2566_08205 [Pectobacterium punjabense]